MTTDILNNNTARPKRIDELVIDDEGHTPSFLNTLTGQIFITNKVGKRLMELADGQHTVEDMIEELTCRFGDVSHATLVKHITSFLDESAGKGLITWPEV